MLMSPLTQRAPSDTNSVPGNNPGTRKVGSPGTVPASLSQASQQWVMSQGRGWHQVVDPMSL